MVIVNARKKAKENVQQGIKFEKQLQSGDFENSLNQRDAGVCFWIQLADDVLEQMKMGGCHCEFSVIVCAGWWRLWARLFLSCSLAHPHSMPQFCCKSLQTWMNQQN